MFKLTEDYAFDWPVAVQKPVDGGSFQTERFTARFVLIPHREVEDVLTGRVENVDEDFLAKVFVGWGDDVMDEDGSPIVFTPEARSRLLSIPYVRSAIARAYFDAMLGGARRKN